MLHAEPVRNRTGGFNSDQGELSEVNVLGVHRISLIACCGRADVSLEYGIYQKVVFRHDVRIGSSSQATVQIVDNRMRNHVVSPAGLRVAEKYFVRYVFKIQILYAVTWIFNEGGVVGNLT